ncbi:MAG: IS66 family transposase [Steroidobacteraceae bacterium]
MLYEPSASDACVPGGSLASAECSLFAGVYVSISKEEHIRLKCEAAYWHGRHQQALHRESVLKEKIEALEARVRDLVQRLFGRRSEKGTTDSEQQGAPTSRPRRPRGQQRNTAGHGRTSLAHLPVREQQPIDLNPEAQCCPKCGKTLEGLPGSDDSEVVEIEVQAYRRRIQRRRYRPTCGCEVLPGIVSAPAPPRLIRRGKLGISIWVEVILAKYLYAQPLNRLLQSWATLGLKISSGTIIGGLRHLIPLFRPVLKAFQGRQLTEGYCHADETGWKVFAAIEGKVGHKWYLWVIRTDCAMVYVMSPGRGASVPMEYFSGLLVQTILVCDRYGAYKKCARTIGILLAFCWAHCRRDSLELARSYPPLRDWAMGWVERIGTLYHLNGLRLQVREDAVLFAWRDADLRAHLEQMREECECALADPGLHRAARKVLMSLKRHWEGLTIFVERPEIRMDNNRAEAALRNEVLGRKAYYGSGSVWAAELAAQLFSVLMTLVHCWQINPRRWLQEYLEACAQNGGRAPHDLSAFLPWTMTPHRLAQLREPAACIPRANTS